MVDVQQAITQLKRIHEEIWRRHRVEAEKLSKKIRWLHPHHAARYIEQFGTEEAARVLSFPGEKIPRGVRVNTLLANPQQVAERLAEKGFNIERHPHLDYGLLAHNEPVSLGATEEYLLGLYSIQGPASMLVVPAMKPEELPQNPLIVDQCAGAGNKATQLAQHRPDATIIALDINRRKLLALRNNASRLAVDNIVALHVDGRRLPEIARPHAVLLDAPCSGEGLIPFPKGQWPRSFTDIQSRVKLQLELASAAIEALQPSGRLLYATCSLSIEENEYVITKLLEAYQDSLKVLEPRAPAALPGYTGYAGHSLDPRVSKCRRYMPHIHGTEGFTICLLEKRQHHAPAP